MSVTYQAGMGDCDNSVCVCMNTMQYAVFCFYFSQRNAFVSHRLCFLLLVSSLLSCHMSDFHLEGKFDLIKF